MARPNIPDLARVAFEEYSTATGGKAHDGEDIPHFDVIRHRSPRIARAWEAAVEAVLTKVALGG